MLWLSHLKRSSKALLRQWSGPAHDDDATHASPMPVLAEASSETFITEERLHQARQRWRTLARHLNLLCQASSSVVLDGARSQLRQINTLLPRMEDVAAVLERASHKALPVEEHERMLLDLTQCEQHLRFLKGVMDDSDRWANKSRDSALYHTRRLWARIHGLNDGQLQAEAEPGKERYLRVAVAATSQTSTGSSASPSARPRPLSVHALALKSDH